MLASSPRPDVEEWAIHDFEGFGAWQPSEYESLDQLTLVASAIGEHGLAVTHWFDYLGEASDEAARSFADAFRGEYKSMSSYLDSLIEETDVQIAVEPPGWERYVKIDEEALRRDLEIELHVADTHDGGVAIFDLSVG